MSGCDVIERARRYLSKVDAAVSGAGGHDVTFKAACQLVKGFDLSPDEAWGVFQEWNGRCDPRWSDKDLRRKLEEADRRADDRGRGYLLKGSRVPSGGAGAGGGSGATVERVAVEPRPVEVKRRQVFDPAALGREGVAFSGLVDFRWLAERSPLPVHGEGVTAGDFLDALYEEGERVLVFTSQFSQGDFLWWVGRGGFRLGREPEVAAVASELPVSGEEGVWFLAQPVSGKWAPNPGAFYADGRQKLTRRSAGNVMAWRYLVLESDDAEEEAWLNFLVQLPVAVAAIYTSGGRSVHALVRVDAASKSDFDRIRDAIVPVLSSLGADPAAVTAVRLTRLPFCFRDGRRGKDGRVVKYRRPRWQRLLYLNPEPELKALVASPRYRVLEADALEQSAKGGRK